MITGLVLSIVPYLALFLPQSWVSVQLEPFQGFFRWLSFVPIAFLLLYVVYGLLKLNYGRYAALQSSLDQKNQEVVELRTPKFKIYFDQGPPFEQRDIWANNEEVQRRWFRIGVKNKNTMMTIDDVVVHLEELHDLSSDPPGKSPVPPIVLRQMNDDPIDGQYRQSFTLHPGSIQFIDVTWKPEADLTADTDEIRLGYAQHQPASIPCRRHALLITVSGRNAPTESGWFFVDVDENGQLLFGPMEALHG